MFTYYKIKRNTHTKGKKEKQKKKEKKKKRKEKEKKDFVLLNQIKVAWVLRERIAVNRRLSFVPSRPTIKCK